MTDRRPTLVCFHGSPGTPDDFRELEPYFRGFRLVRPVRPGYPEANFSQSTLNQGRCDGRILIGYSWGCLAALREAVEFPTRVAAIVLIAPHLYPHPASRLMQTLLRTPILGRSLLARRGRSIVDQLLTRSAFPVAVPDSYRQLASRLAHPASLCTAVLEKSEPGLFADDALDMVRKWQIPLAMIRGADDQVSPAENQVIPVRHRPPGFIDYCFDNAGHALLWTHTKEVANAIHHIFRRLKPPRRGVAV